MNTKINILGITFLTLLVAGITASSISNMSVQVFAEPQKFAIQKTDKSVKGPLPGHEGHQIVMALPLRDDGKMYMGFVTYSASKPVEIVVFNPFNATVTDEEHGLPLNTPIGNNSVAISLMKQFNGEFNAGSFPFVGSALVFHNVNGDPFSISYAVTGKVLNQTGLPP
ncbi:MAG: hypothetical protein ACPKPY_04920 [Nitrososphaeraceae archaeon]